MNIFHCQKGEEITKFKLNEVSSGYMRHLGNGGQFVIGKIKKQNGVKTLVKGRTIYKVLIYDNGNMLLSYKKTTSSTGVKKSNNQATTSTTSTVQSYYIVKGNVVSKVPGLPKKISGWETIFTSCPKHTTIIEQFNNRQKGDYWTVADLANALSSYYYRECYTEF